MFLLKKASELLKKAEESTKSKSTPPPSPKTPTNSPAVSEKDDQSPPGTPYNSASLNVDEKTRSPVDEGVIIVNAQEVKDEVHPELISLQKLPQFEPLLKVHLSLKPQNTGSLDIRGIVNICTDCQNFLREKSKVIGQRQSELASKIRETNHMYVKKAEHNIVLRVTDTKHFETQFKEVDRFCSNLERTYASIKDLVASIQRLNNLLPKEERLEPLQLENTNHNNSNHQQTTKTKEKAGDHNKVSTTEELKPPEPPISPPEVPPNEESQIKQP